MLAMLRNRLGIPGVISVIALVFAMIGGAYAANNSGGGAATASKKAKRGPTGPKGPKGDAGPAGPVGPAGANGHDGSAGAQGAAGSAGEKGATGATGAAGAPGSAGATGATGATGAAGAAGATGPEGVCSKAGCTLPSGTTETGSWAATIDSAAYSVTAIPFAIPLASEVPITIVKSGTGVAPCTGGTAAAPKADAGNLCLYVNEFQEGTPTLLLPFGAGTGTIGKASKTGAVLELEGIKGIIGWGSFAVTAP